MHAALLDDGYALRADVVDAAGLAELLLVRYADGPAHSTRLAAMAFLISYTLTAAGPALIGALRDATGSFTASWTVLLVVSLAQLAVALRLPAPD